MTLAKISLHFILNEKTTNNIDNDVDKKYFWHYEMPPFYESRSSNKAIVSITEKK